MRAHYRELDLNFADVIFGEGLPGRPSPVRGEVPESGASIPAGGRVAQLAARRLEAADDLIEALAAAVEGDVVEAVQISHRPVPSGVEHDRAVGVSGQGHPEFQDDIGPGLHGFHGLVAVLVRLAQFWVEADHVIGGHQDTAA